MLLCMEIIIIAHLLQTRIIIVIICAVVQLPPPPSRDAYIYIYNIYEIYTGREYNILALIDYKIITFYAGTEQFNYHSMCNSGFFFSSIVITDLLHYCAFDIATAAGVYLRSHYCIRTPRVRCTLTQSVVKK